MALTLHFTQLARKKLKNGEIPIYLRLTENRKTKYLSTGISVKPQDWNPRNEVVRKSHPLCVQYNSELTKIKIKAEGKKSELRQEDELDISTLKDQLAFNKGKTIEEFSEEYRESLKEDNRYWEHRHFGVLLNDLASMGVLTTPVSRIDQAFIEQFKSHLFNTVKNGNNTVRKKLQRLKSMIKEATIQGYISNDPFRLIEPIKRINSSKAKLGIEQIEAIKKLDLIENSSLWHVRNYFMFSYYMAGIRFSDLCTLTPSNIVDGRLRYSMSKTKGEKNIVLHKEPSKILSYYNTDSEGYIFPILDRVYTDEFILKKKISSKNVLVNRELKTLAKKAGIQENVSFHVSRHSFANYALKQGVNIYSISKALAHSDLKTTEIYLSAFDEEMLDNDMEALFETS